MMIHEKLMPGQFMLDFKNDRTGLLNPHLHNQRNQTELHPPHQQHPALTAHFLSHHHHHLQQQQQQHLHQHHHHQSLQLQQQPPSPPLSALKMDLYAAYAYQQQQQQLLNNKSNNKIIDQQQQQQHTNSKSEALDLSRRCDSVETPRKTPSPAHTSSSTSTASPTASPNNTSNHHQLPSLPQPIIPSNLLFSTDAPQQQMPLPPSLATLYPALYYSSGIIKPEPICPSSPCTTPPPPPPPPQSAIIPSNTQVPIAAASELLQTFATAAAVAGNATHTPTSPKSQTAEYKSLNSNPPLMTPTSPQLNSLPALDVKNTRPFKAFPRDPLVIAANFAATDVLLDNPRVERYTEFRKRMWEEINSSNGGARTITNPKMRRTNSRNTDGEGNGSLCRSSSEERHEETGHAGCNSTTADDSSDCDSNAGNFEKSTGEAGETQNSNSSNTITTNSSGAVVKDAAYYERRRKNNAAAKKSRDRRRIKEDEIAIRAAYLERQNIELLCQIDALKTQLATFTSKNNA